ncbi:MAG: DUF922 domain-containing protein [Bacteroidota bacterium]
MKNWLSIKFDKQFLIFLLLFIGSVTLQFLDAPGSKPLTIIVPILFSIISFFNFLSEGVNYTDWDFKRLLVSLLYFTISLKIFYIYYNVFIAILLVATSVYVLVSYDLNSEKIKSRLSLLTVIVTILIFIPDRTLLKFYQKADRKVWGNEIQWEDFEGSKPKDIYPRLSRVSFTISYDYNRVYNYPNFISVTTMVKSLSWVKSGYDYDTELLEHERLHVDISEVIRREFEDSVRYMKYKDSHKIREMYLRLMDKNKEMQAEYDRITNHGLDSIQQTKWNKKIESLLK